MTDTDTLSLTLPKGKARTRRRKPKLPPWRFWWYLAWALYGGYVVVTEIQRQRWAHAVLVLSCVVLYWRTAHRLNDGRPNYPARWLATYLAAYIALLLFLDIAGIA